MEHEDNAHLDNLLQSSPHLMENLQMASGVGLCDNVAEEIGGNIGGKFEEHDEHDDEEEWKYIKEGQQSEKQQQRINAGIDCKDVEGGEVGNGHGYENELCDVGSEDVVKFLDKHEVGNCVVGISALDNADATNGAAGIEVNEEILKNDGDFSTTSNTTSTAGEDIEEDTGVMQVDMKIDPMPEVQLLPQQVENILVSSKNGEETEEDEPSSLATNNTNRTNSLSENVPHKQLQQDLTEENYVKDEEFFIEDKENADPLLSNTIFESANEQTKRPNDLNLETHSQLNPNALEFVPSFGSTPASPIATTSDNVAFAVGEPALNNAAEIQLQPHPSTIARHLLGDDDFVAQSPRKGSGESNLDGIALPEENDFEHEAAKRPHELEQEEDLIGVGAVENSQPQPYLLHEQLENHNNDGVHLREEYKNFEEDCMNNLRQSPVSLIDHGPETSVDLDADITMQISDVQEVIEKQELPADEHIEDVLNTVQPLPTDIESLNNSFIEEPSQQELIAAGKELFNIEEKENISHSPSTEEMQMNLQNEFHSSAKDIPQIPIDMDNAAHMQESFYIESTSSEARHQIDEPFGLGDNNTSAVHDFVFDEINTNDDKKLFSDSHISFEQNIVSDAPSPSLNIFAPVFTLIQQSVETDENTQSLLSAEEKHLVEETKELITKSDTIGELEQKLDALELSTKDEILSQVEEVAQSAAHIVESLNPFAEPEPEQQATAELSPIEAEEPYSIKSLLPTDFLQQSEQFYRNQPQEENESEPINAHHEDNFISTHPEEQPPASPAMIPSALNGFDEPAAASFVSPAVLLQPEPALEPTFVAHPDEVSAEQKPITEPEPELILQPESALTLEPQPELVNALLVSDDIVTNVSTGDEPFLVVCEELPVKAPEVTPEPILDEPVQHVEQIAVAATAVGAIAATAAAATIVGAATKKNDDKKPRTPSSTKSKPADIKKAADPVKKPVAARTSTLSAPSARPRTAPAKSLTSDKKLTATSTAAKPTTTTTTASRKPLTSTTATARTITKTTSSARPSTAPATAKPAASRTTTTTTARRSAPTSTGGSTTISNGTAAKPKPASGAPTKPTTLGLSTTTKPKLSSPRTTLTSQLRKAAPTSAATGLNTARSPLKTTAPTTNGVTKSSATTKIASRAKSSTSTTVTTTTTKTFTARPAPKTTHLSSLSTTTTRRTTGTASSSGTVGSRTTNSTLLKKSPLSSAKPATAGKSSLSPTKTSSAALKSKTKDVTKKPTTPNKAASELKEKIAAEQSKANGTGAVDELGNKFEKQAHLNGQGDGPQKLLENGTHLEELENGESSLLEQHVQAPLIDA